MISVTLNRVSGDYGFEAVDANGRSVLTDTSTESGGVGNGVRPMQMLLMALGGCNGIDVVMILKKQKQQLTNFSMQIDGEREPGKEPSLWKTIHINFQLSGTVDVEKAKRACSLSVEKYCSVAETLRRAGANITWEVTVN
jgi:putative redox protein